MKQGHDAYQQIFYNVLRHFEKMKDKLKESIAEEDDLAICTKKFNLCNNHVESDKENDKCQNINLHSLRQENPNRPIFAQININSMRNKFQFLASQTINNVDVLLVSETKLDDSSPKAQFSTPYRLDRCSNGSGIRLYVKDDISSHFLAGHRLMPFYLK